LSIFAHSSRSSGHQNGGCNNKRKRGYGWPVLCLLATDGGEQKASSAIKEETVCTMSINKKLKAVPIPKVVQKLTPEDFIQLSSKQGLIKLLKAKNINPKSALGTLRYEAELRQLQIELVKLQRDVQLNGRRVVILFEGRDAAGKGGAIRRFTEHLNPRSMRVVALPKPTEVEKGQWYFQRYVKNLPNPGEIAFFDRSWYNRAVVEPVMKFCKKSQYAVFMQQVPEFEHMLYEDNVEIIKFWFSISKSEQERRFKRRVNNPLKQWKISPVDDEAQANWDLYTMYKEEMFSKTHTSYSPWIIVKANSKMKARLEAIRHVLNTLPYKGKVESKVTLHPDPAVVLRFHRRSKVID
jgi:polyphosphate kinase 2